MTRTARRIAGVLACVAQAATTLAAVEWQDDVESSLARARAELRPVLLYFTAEWCAPCRRMDEVFWPRHEVATTTGRMICVRVDFDHDRRLAARYGVASIPALVILDPWGMVIATERGYQEPHDRLLRLLADIPTEFDEIIDQIARLSVEPKDRDALLAMGRFYYQRGFASASLEFFERALKVTNDPTARANVLVGIGWCQLKLGDHRSARKSLMKSLKVAPDRPDPTALLGLVEVAIAERDLRAARSWQDELVAQYPRAQETAIAADLLSAALASR